MDRARVFVHALVVAIAAAEGCKQNERREPGDVGPRDCPRRLAELCAQVPCEYEALRIYAKKYERCTSGEAGTCGAHRYVAFEAYDGGYVVYFDANGQAIGGESRSDVNVANACRSYGEAPSCERNVAEHLCGLNRGRRSM